MRKTDYYDICIVGGGASGMAAAAAALEARDDARIVILEKNDITGRKLRATGSGRCNITNTSAPGYCEVMEFFRELGLATREYPNGLVYPYSESANDVAELLTDRITEMGCGIITGAAVMSVRKSVQQEGAFEVSYSKKDSDGITMDHRILADKVILAVGGKAGPNFGTTGDGYRFARELGHSLVKPVPVLTQVICDGDECGSLSGIRAKGRVSLYRDETGRFGDDTMIFSEDGEIQFTYYGLSGIAVFNMTRMMRLPAGVGFEAFAVDVDLFPEADIMPFLSDQRNDAVRRGSGLKCGAILRTVLKPEIAGYILKRSGIDASRRISSLTEEELRAIASNVHALRFRPTGLKGWKEAQCTSGGVPLDEIDCGSCESLLAPGLFITGELMDYDGPCGGYNLTNAWITGIAAGRAAVSGSR